MKPVAFTTPPKAFLLIGLAGILSGITAHAAAYRDEVLTDNPLAYWRLGETSGSVAVDQVVGGTQNGGYGGGFALNQPGALSGDADPSVKFVGGAFGTGNGTGDTLFAGRSVITVEFWVKPNANETGIHYLEYGLSAFAFEGTSLNPIFYVNNNNVGSITLTQGVFTHIALQLDGTDARIFQDGLNISTVPFNQMIAEWNTEFFLASRNGYTRFVNADLDEVAVYATALSPARIQEHFDSAPIPEPASGLLLLGSLVGLASRRRRN